MGKTKLKLKQRVHLKSKNNTHYIMSRSKKSNRTYQTGNLRNRSNKKQSKDMDHFLNKITNQYTKEKKSIEHTYRRKPIKSANSLLKEEISVQQALESKTKREKSRYKSRNSRT